MPKLEQWGDRVCFYCVGCKEVHGVPFTLSEGRYPGKWNFNGDFEKPTLNPSLLTKRGHFNRPGELCWCTFNKEQIEKGEEPSSFICVQCHLFLQNGQIQYLSDCSHEYAGQTVDLVEIPQ